MKKTMVSVLIPTFNAEKDIELLLKKIYDQKLKENQELEVVIVDSSSTDNTINVIREKFPSVIMKVIDNEKFNHGGTRNYLADISRGDYLLYLTQDAIPYNQELIQELLSSFENQNVEICYARQIPKKDAKPLEVFARNFNYPDKDTIKDKSKLKDLGIKTFFNSNVCSMYRRTAFEAYSQFPDNIILNEDMILASKVILDGKFVSYNSRAMVYHSHNYNLKQQFKRYFDIGMAFHQTSYLLKYASNEKEGVRMVINQIKYLYSQKKPIYIPYAIVESGMKFIGYNMGKKSRYIPLPLKRKFSAYMK